MSQKQQVILNTPARKVFASQLHNDSIHADSSNQVWLQGIVVLVSADGNDLFLDDGTGIIQANGVTRIVKDLFIQKGMYVMVAGQLRSSVTITECLPSIRVLKIADLTNNAHSEALWLTEVIHAQLKRSAP